MRATFDSISPWSHGALQKTKADQFSWVFDFQNSIPEEIRGRPGWANDMQRQENPCASLREDWSQLFGNMALDIATEWRMVDNGESVVKHG